MTTNGWLQILLFCALILMEDVLELLNHDISVITAVNIQHIESLNDAVARTTGVRVRETVPDHFFRRADEVVNVDISTIRFAPDCARERSTVSRRSSSHSTTSSAKETCRR